jgi:hypothetical protein
MEIYEPALLLLQKKMLNWPELARPALLLLCWSETKKRARQLSNVRLYIILNISQFVEN